MRRSSTTVSGPATVLLRRYGEKLLQNSNDSTRPSAPATIRMHRLSIGSCLLGPCIRHCCYGSCINGKEEPARLDAVYTRTACSD
jgi:hypothetical protein